MDLKDFAMTQKGKHITMVAAVADKTGANDYEMRIAGPPAAIKRIFAKSDFAIEIDPHRKTQNLKKQLIEHTEQEKKTFADLARLEGTHERDLFTKPTVEDPDPDKSVFISLQRTRGEGTLWTLAFPFSCGVAGISSCIHRQHCLLSRPLAQPRVIKTSSSIWLPARLWRHPQPVVQHLILLYTRQVPRRPDFSQYVSTATRPEWVHFLWRGF